MYIMRSGYGVTGYTVENLVMKLSNGDRLVDRYYRAQITQFGKLLAQKSKTEQVILLLENPLMREVCFKWLRRHGFINFLLITANTHDFLKFKKSLLTRKEINRIFVVRRSELKILRQFGEVIYVPDPDRVFILG